MNKKLLSILLVFGVTLSSFPATTTIANDSYTYIDDSSVNTVLIGSNAESKILDFYGWTKNENGIYESKNKRLKFENLNGVDNKDAVLTFICDDESEDENALNLLSLMVDEEMSKYSTMELAYIIANGSSTITDGYRIINIQYDGNISYCITVTFYEYNNTSSIVPPSDTPTIVPPLEEELNKEDVNEDGDINILDLSLVSNNLTTFTHEQNTKNDNYDETFDINNDLIVDLFDLIKISLKL